MYKFMYMCTNYIYISTHIYRHMITNFKGTLYNLKSISGQITVKRDSLASRGNAIFPSCSFPTWVCDIANSPGKKNVVIIILQKHVYLLHDKINYLYLTLFP